MPSTASYDYARLIAAFGIVLFHAGAPGAAVGYAALPFFLMLMIGLGWQSADRDRFGDYAQGRFVRLIQPWLIWSAIYGGLKLLEVAVTRVPLSTEFAPHMLLTGPALHLWFLPFAFVICLLLWPLARGARWMPAESLAVLALGLGLALHGLRQGQELPAPVAQWAYVAPAVCLGVGFAVLHGRALAQVGLIAAFACVAGLAGWGAGLLQPILAAAVVFFCGYIALPRTRWSAMAAQASMGVYLAHPLIFSLLDRGTPLTKSSLIYASLAGSAALCLTLLQIRFAHWRPKWPAMPKHRTSGNTITSEAH